MINNKPYFSMHNHSEFSNLTMIDSLNRIPEMVDYALELGLTGLALTDHEALSGSVQLLQYYEKLPQETKDNFKVVIGDEIYLVDDVNQQKMNHFLLLAKNKKGFEQLKKISSQAWENSYKKGMVTRRPITKEQLKEIIGDEVGNLVATTACLAGEFPVLVNELVALEMGHEIDENIIQNKKNEIINFMIWGMETFGKDNFKVEIQPSNQRDQIIFNAKAKELAQVFELDIVVTTDSHYLTVDDKVTHEAFLASKDMTRNSAQFYTSAYMMSSQEIYEYSSICKVYSEEEFCNILDNTNKILQGCEMYDVSHKQEVPFVDRSKELSELIEKHGVLNLDFNKYPNLKRIILEKDMTNMYWLYRIYDFLNKKDLLNHEYISRIDLEAEELYGISERLDTNLFGYYVTMTRIMELAWDDANAIVGVSRGSVAGFLSAWALEIQGVDSIKYELPHWRHISKERPELPDIDFDTPASRRTNLILATRNYFGEDKVLNIATFKTEGARSALLTACRGYRSDEFPSGIPLEEAEYLSSMIKSERGISWGIYETYYGNAAKERKPSAQFIANIDKYEGLLDIALRIEGIISGRSIHASGVYIYNEEYTKYNAMMKAPNGAKTTQFNMADSDYQGGLKFDYLTVDALDIIQETLNLLIENAFIDEQPTLKETYDSILAPDILVDSDDLWAHAYNRDMLSLFQFDTPVGGDAISRVKPHDLREAAHVNSLMRLMATEKGGETPTDKFIRFKNNINEWYREMNEAGLTKEEVQIMEKHFLKVYGVPATQEELMIVSMDKDVANFGLIQANKLRKAIAKKKASVMEEVKVEFFESGRAAGTSDNLLHYVWDYVAMPQAGYSFSSLHTTGYTMIALQELTLFHNYPSIYWNTSVLLVNSASVEEVIDERFIEVEYDDDGNEVDQKKKSAAVDYGKIAKSIGEIKSAGIEVAPPHINKALKRFEADVHGNRILYSLKSLAWVGDNEIEKIIEGRPYTSLEDFLERCHIEVRANISLIKSGAFDELENRPRVEIMKDFIRVASKPKSKLNLQNFKGLLDYEVIPDELSYTGKLWNFNKYIRQKQFKINGTLRLDERGQAFMENNYPDFYATAELEDNNLVSVSEKEWKKIYDKEMDVARKWLKDNQEVALADYNQKLFNEVWEKYCVGSLPKWEMDSMSFYSQEHELAHLDFNRYQIANFAELPREPRIETMFNPRGTDKYIPIYEITKIVGTCINKDKQKSTFTLLTPEGSVVDIKLSNDHFAYYNKRISEKDEYTGKSSIKENSWFNRGNKLMIVGFKRNNSFVPKRYARTPEEHRVYLINDVNDNGEMLISSQRWGVEAD